ncbi:MAG: tetratricopeptide repeat protein [Anaerolineaceae bacterium]|nr:tetratricopeptide repeat protein [Anaerolineaceae bacterium]
MNISPRRPLFNRKPQSNIYRLFIWVIMLLGGVWVLQQINSGEIEPLFQATPTLTRSPESLILEGEAYFSAGNVNAAIQAYRAAAAVDPNNAQTWTKLSRIQTYSSAFLITNDEKKARLAEALESAAKAIELAPEDSSAHAVRAFALNWSANPNFRTTDEIQNYLRDAEAESLTALQLDSSNTLALVYYAEVLLDQQKWDQAELTVKQALAQDDTIMDVHRVYAAVLETFGQYELAIAEWDKAIAIEPNFTFLYTRAGANYRILAFNIASKQGVEEARPTYEKSLEYFDRAVRINEQIGVKDPGPHLSIARTYSQLGEYFAAARNVQKALQYEPTNSDIYGQLGIVYFRSRNYEGSIFSLKCAAYGCSGEDSCMGRGLEKCFPDLDENPVVVPGLAISPNTIVYYYVYGSVLSALSRPRDNKCDEAMKVMGDVRAELRANPDAYKDSQQTILGIVETGELICASLSSGSAPTAPAPNASGTGTPGAGDAAPNLTATPTP